MTKMNTGKTMQSATMMNKVTVTGLVHRCEDDEQVESASAECVHFI